MEEKKMKTLVRVVIALFAMLTMSQYVTAKDIIYKGRAYSGKVKKGIPCGEGWMNFGDFELEGVFNGDTVTNGEIGKGPITIKGTFTYDETKGVTVVDGIWTIYYYTNTIGKHKDKDLVSLSDRKKTTIKRNGVKVTFDDDFMNNFRWEIEGSDVYVDWNPSIPTGRTYSYEPIRELVLKEIFNGLNVPQRVYNHNEEMTIKRGYAKDQNGDISARYLVLVETKYGRTKDEKTGIAYSASSVDNNNYSIFFPENKMTFRSLNHVEFYMTYENGDKMTFDYSTYKPQLQKPNGVIINGSLVEQGLKFLKKRYPAFSVSSIENLDVKGKTNEEIEKILEKLLAPHKPRLDVQINPNSEDITQRGFYSLIPGTQERKYMSEQESLLTYIKDIDKTIWESGSMKWIWRPDGSVVQMECLTPSQGVFAEGIGCSKSELKEMPSFVIYTLSENRQKWSRKGFDFVLESTTYTTPKWKVGDIAYDMMPIELRNKVKAGLPKFEAKVKEMEKKSWNNRSPSTGKIVICTPNTLGIKWADNTYYYYRDNEMMSKVNGNFDNADNLFSAYVEDMRKDFEEFVNTYIFADHSLESEPLPIYEGEYTQKRTTQYLPSIANKDKGESDQDYINKNLKWPRSAINSGVVEADVSVWICVDRDGIAKVEDVFVTSAKNNKDLVAEITRVIESAKWNPGIVGTTKVKSVYNHRFKFTAI